MSLSRLGSFVGISSYYKVVNDGAEKKLKITRFKLLASDYNKINRYLNSLNPKSIQDLNTLNKILDINAGDAKRIKEICSNEGKTGTLSKIFRRLFVNTNKENAELSVRRANQSTINFIIDQKVKNSTPEERKKFFGSSDGEEYLSSERGKEFLKSPQKALDDRIEEMANRPPPFKEKKGVAGSKGVAALAETFGETNLQARNLNETIHRLLGLNETDHTKLSDSALKIITEEQAEGSSLLELALDKGQMVLLNKFFSLPPREDRVTLNDEQVARMAKHLPDLITKLADPAKRAEYIASAPDANVYDNLFKVEKGLVHMFYHHEPLFHAFKKELEFLPNNALPAEFMLYKEMSYGDFKSIIDKELGEATNLRNKLNEASSLQPEQKLHNLNEIQKESASKLDRLCIGNGVEGNVEQLQEVKGKKTEEDSWGVVLNAVINGSKLNHIIGKNDEGLPIVQKNDAGVYFNRAFSPLSPYFHTNCHEMKANHKPVLNYLLDELTSDQRTDEQKSRIKEMIKIIVMRSPTMMDQKFDGSGPTFRERLETLQGDLKQELSAFASPKNILEARVFATFRYAYVYIGSDAQREAMTTQFNGLIPEKDYHRYVGDMGTEKFGEKMKTLSAGDFLLRDSQSTPKTGQYQLKCKVTKAQDPAGEISIYVRFEGGKVKIENKEWDSLDALVKDINKEGKKAFL